MYNHIYIYCLQCQENVFILKKRMKTATFNVASSECYVFKPVSKISLQALPTGWQIQLNNTC